MTDIPQIAARIEGGARKTLLLMTDQWQFCGKQTFNANGAHALHWQKGVGGLGALCERELQKDVRGKRDAYRLTPLGQQVAQYLRNQHNG